MADQILKNSKGIPIGKIVTSSNGILTIKDEKGIPKGTYDPKSNKTKNHKGIPIGTGNLLVTLL